jgi:hypothetical protein
VFGLPHEVHRSSQYDGDEERAPERLVVRDDHHRSMPWHVLGPDGGEAAEHAEDELRSVLHQPVERTVDTVLPCHTVGVIVRDRHGFPSRRR